MVTSQSTMKLRTGRAGAAASADTSPVVVSIETPWAVMTGAAAALRWGMNRAETKSAGLGAVLSRAAGPGLWNKKRSSSRRPVVWPRTRCMSAPKPCAHASPVVVMAEA
jgi:hypothetical protein